MDGVLDWFFGKRSPEEGPRSIFQAFGAPPPTPAPALPGLPAPQGSGLPIPRPQTPPVSARPSMFDVFLPAAPPAAGGLIPAERPEPAGPLIFRSFAPTPPASVEPAAEQPILWFPQEPERPFGSFFGPFEETAQEPVRWRPGEYSRGMPLWTLTNWALPTTWEIHDLVTKDWDTNSIFETVLSEAATQYWRRAVQESTHYGPATIEIDRVARRDAAFEDFAQTFRIPRQVLDLYFGNVTTDEDAREASARFMEEVLDPLIERYEKVLDLLKPSRELRGWFEFAPDRETGDWWLTYKEAVFRPQLGWAGRID